MKGDRESLVSNIEILLKQGQQISHILVVRIHDKSNRISDEILQSKLFSLLHNKAMNISCVNLTLNIVFKSTGSSSTQFYYCNSIYNDILTHHCAKSMLSSMLQELRKLESSDNLELEFMLTVPNSCLNDAFELMNI